MSDKITKCPKCSSKFLSKDIREIPNNFNIPNEELEMEATVPPGFEKRVKRAREEGPSNINKSQSGEKNNEKNNISDKNVHCVFNKGQKKNLPKVPINLFDDECAFCHSWRTTKAHGEMLCYKKGKLISPEEAEKSTSKVIYVHQTCFDWSPSIHFSGDKIVNLEKEINRANKLNCHKCGRKGAALGCYYEHCNKSYHVPCAVVEIPECRWDTVNYNMLCPDHVSEKLKCDEPPNETNDMDCSKEPVAEAPPQQIVEKQIIIHNDNSLQNKKIKFVLLCSALSQHEKGLVEEFASKNGATIIEEWRNDVTHIITSENATCSCRRIRRTHQVMMAILNGSWIVTIEWIETCLENEELVSEESYEVNQDFYGDFHGPRKGRIRASQKAPNLFARLGFSLSTYLPENKKKQVEELVTAGGGKITNKNGNFSLMDLTAKRRVLTNYLVYDVNPKGSSEINKEFLEFGKKDECSKLVSYSRVLEAVGDFDTDVLNKVWYQDS